MSKVENAIQVIEEKAEKYSVNGLRTQQLLTEMGNFQVKIVLIGAFSAGKSAMLNALLGRDLLQEDQRPETAVASELLYDRQEYVEVVSKTGIKRCTLEEAVGVDVSSVQHLRWHLSDVALRELEGYVLVDMPGFNSGIQNHNRAILQYADQANAYLLVIDAEDGGIKRSVSSFLDEVRHYEDNVAIVITKSDLKIEDDVALVRENVEEMARDMFGQDVTVIATSKFDSQIRKKLCRLIRQFDREKIFRQCFVPPVREMGQQVIGVMEVLKKNASLDVADLEEEIRSREKAKTQLSKKLQNERQRLVDRLQNSVQPSILADAENALQQQAEVLANRLENGGAGFSMLVNNILRPVLATSTQTYVEDSFDEFVSAVVVDTRRLEDANLGDVLGRYQQINEDLKNLPEHAGHFNAVYKALTTSFAVLTSAIAPWLELILIFLPDIIKAIAPLFQRDQKDKLLNEVQNRVIPGIIQKLGPSVSSSLREIEADMVAQLEEKLGEMIDLETSALENAKNKLAQQQEDHTRKLETIDQDIEDICVALDAM